MATQRARGELISPTDIANLTVSFYDGYGNPANTIGFPAIAIVQPSGAVALNTTTAGVSQIGVGQYLYSFSAPFNGPLGVWNDIWQGNVNGTIITSTLSFIIETTQLPNVNSDGYQSLGDDPGFNYSQIAISNINKLLKALKVRLNSSGKSKSTDAYGNVIYVDCDIFSNEVLVTMLAMSLTNFNQIPYYSFFTMDDTFAINQFFDIIVEGAVLTALASQQLIERGREFVINDNGVSFTPPLVSDVLGTQWGAAMTAYNERLRYIKNSLRGGPFGLVQYSTMTGRNPAIHKLIHLRARQII